MSGFVDTLEQNKEFRRDFNRVVRFFNGLFWSQNQRVATQDIETGSRLASTQSDTNWFVTFMRAFVNTTIESTTATATPQPNDLVWQDTLIFLNHIKDDNNDKIKEKILKFVTTIINCTNDSRHLTSEQKDLILDKLFADPYKNKRMSLPLKPELIIFTSIVLDLILLIKFLSSFDETQNTFTQQAYGGALLAALFLTIASFRLCPTRPTFQDPIAEDTNSLIAWVHEVSEELLRLQLPCEPDTDPIATAVIADTNYPENSKNPVFNRISELFDIAIAGLVKFNSSNADLLLQDNMARRSLDTLIKFMHNNIAKNNVPTAFPKSAVNMYLQIRATPYNMSQILQQFLNDYKSGVHNSTQITNLQKDELLDLILSNRQATTADTPSFKMWLFKMGGFCDRFNGTLDPLVVHDVEAVGENAIDAIAGSPRRNQGYELVHKI